MRAEHRGPTLPPWCWTLASLPPTPLRCQPGVPVSPGQLLQQPMEGDSPGTLQGGRLGAASAPARAAATEKREFKDTHI